VFLVIVGVILWLINTYVPLQSPIKTLINIVVIIIVVVWLLQALGLLGVVNQPLPKVR
jgi:uncharacterized protein YhhL (DUF1145 family)